MDIWSVDMEAVPEHLGTASSKYLIPKESMQEATSGTYLALVSVFEVAGGTTMAAHHHPTHEFWFVVQGEAVMQVADEARTIKVGDLIYTKPGTPHQIRVESPETFRALAFALGYPGQGSQHLDVELDTVEPA
ncbi:MULTISPECIES: cupin domain-containing protein [Streptomyces]|uniref:cupin domain-containing protein n=1 Tax=Streptomyces TaxID=1883 RepID=UPI00037332F8|nr:MULTISPECIES: cupin domain-containing protein [Streptomyces]MDH6554772.1 mannose-6-phosphate isomerase-like protein (cupin superfamily) [Streptomyces sp. SAI-041]